MSRKRNFTREISYIFTQTAPHAKNLTKLLLHNANCSTHVYIKCVEHALHSLPVSPFGKYIFVCAVSVPDRVVSLRLRRLDHETQR